MYINKPTAQVLSAPGRTTTINVGTLGLPIGSYEVVVAAINTNVVVSVDESSSATFASDVVKHDTRTITANGTYIFPVYSLRPYIALNFDSETGGTAATVTATLRLNTN